MVEFCVCAGSHWLGAGLELLKCTSAPDDRIVSLRIRLDLALSPEIRKRTPPPASVSISIM